MMTESSDKSANTFFNRVWNFLSTHYNVLIDAAILIAIFYFMTTYFPLSLLTLDTTPTGGDIPAHNYLVSHLHESIKHGSLISWADGWWSGFPMYQFYFFLPYLIMALLAFVIPINIAFKIVSIAGIFGLPLCLYLGTKQLKGPRAAAPLAAVASVPFLFVQTHTMWGVNVKSTLAGMIANSMSFCLFVLFLGYALADLKEKRMRPITAVILTLLFYSHFFTTLTAVLVSGACVFVLSRQWLPRIKALLPSGIIAVLCAAFWLFPLMAKTQFSVEFGGDWDENLLETFPFWAKYIAVFAAVALGFGAWKRDHGVGMYVVMFLISLFFWTVGGRINSSFGNIRFWPFVFFAFMMLCVYGMAYLMDFLRYERIAVVGAVFVILSLQSMDKDEVSGWFKWNNDGVERKSSYSLLKEMMDEMKGTPGRFVVDQAHANNRFGSDRIFEAFPAMIGKPFIVGGIVNSATGALFGYTVQCEFSKGCAGFPKLVNPPRFNPEVGLRHAELFSISHVIAYWDKLETEMDKYSDTWPKVRQIKDYSIYARKGGPAPWVYVPKFRPAYLETDKWKERSLEWFSVPDLLDTPFAFLSPGENIPDSELSLKFDLATYYGLIAKARPDLTEITSWSMLGPFYHDPENDKKDPLKWVRWNPIGVDEAALRPGRNIKGKTWNSYVREGNIDVDAMINPSHHLIIYAYSGLYSDREQTIQLLVASDDEVAVFFNGQHKKNARRHSSKNPVRLKVRLREGRNDLIIKLNQGLGGAFYHVRAQTLEGELVPGLRYGPNTFGASPLEMPAFTPTKTDCAVNVTQFDDQGVKFTTDCPGEPHIIKRSYYPNWKLRKGAAKIYHASPNFMLVYPREREVEIYYGSTSVDVVSRILTLIGYILLAGSFWYTRKKNYSKE